MADGFCGNQSNHPPHTYEVIPNPLPLYVDKMLGNCGGVSRHEIQEEIGVDYDPVKIPGHYNSGTIEVTNFIADQQLDFPRGNVVKYVSRAGKKDPATEVQDLEKAAAYLQMAHNLANGLPAVVRDPVTKEVVWSLFKN